MSSYDSLIKFSVGDAFYTFDALTGTIDRKVVNGITISSRGLLPTSIPSVPVAIKYRCSGKDYSSDDVYTEAEIRAIAADWLLEKSISMFSEAGL